MSLSPAIEPVDPASDADADRALGALRGLITLLVVVHHAVLAYHPFAPPVPWSMAMPPQWWGAFPVADVDHWGNWAWLVGWNDAFFMSLMFLLSGVYVARSLGRKGPARFVRERAVRLGLPFVAMVVLLAPLAYFATYVQTGGDADPIAFAGAWRELGMWLAGPGWFLWVLLAFDVIAALLWRVRAPLRRVAAIASRPIGLALLVLASLIAYVTMVRKVGDMTWDHVGPCYVQTARGLHYALYFAAGALIGGRGLGAGVLSSRGGLARAWWLLAPLAIAVFYASVRVDIHLMTGGDPIWAWASQAGFALSCAASSFACLALALRFARRSRMTSLRGNAYGIYLVHYPIVAWLQLAFVRVELSGLWKGVAVSAAAIAASWLLTAALRRVPPIGRVIGSSAG